jgi:hypothetical protein
MERFLLGFLKLLSKKEDITLKDIKAIFKSDLDIINNNWEIGSQDFGDRLALFNIRKNYLLKNGAKLFLKRFYPIVYSKYNGKDFDSFVKSLSIYNEKYPLIPNYIKEGAEFKAYIKSISSVIKAGRW